MQTIFTHHGYGYSKRLCENVSVWFLNKYLSQYNLHVDILHRGLKREHADGYCDMIKRPNKFQIELDTYMDKELYIKTLLHEFTHLRQWREGRLFLQYGFMCYSKNKDEVVMVSDYDYFEQPHEIEAREQEELLYHEYMLSSLVSVSEVAQ